VLPAHGLARLNEAAGEMDSWISDQKVADRDNDEQDRDNRQQIDMSGIVTMGLNFPAHR
jgi:hypothetical protein